MVLSHQRKRFSDAKDYGTWGRVFGPCLSGGNNMKQRYRIICEDAQIIGPACGTLWERPIINEVLKRYLPDHSQDHLPLSDCDVGTLEWDTKE